MGQPAIVQVTGAVTVSPVSCGPGSPSLQETMQIFVYAAYSGSKSGRPTVSAPLDDPYVVPFEGITNVRFLSIESVGQVPMKLLLTSPNGGVDQVIPFSNRVLIHSPADGDEMTAIKIVGNGGVSYVLAGDAG